MKLTINLSNEMIRDLLKFSNTNSKEQAIIFALKEWVREQKIKNLKSLRGKLQIELDVEKQRAEDLQRLLF